MSFVKGSKDRNTKSMTLPVISEDLLNGLGEDDGTRLTKIEKQNYRKSFSVADLLKMHSKDTTLASSTSSIGKVESARTRSNSIGSKDKEKDTIEASSTLRRSGGSSSSGTGTGNSSSTEGFTKKTRRLIRSVIVNPKEVEYMLNKVTLVPPAPSSGLSTDRTSHNSTIASSQASTDSEASGIYASAYSSLNSSPNRRMINLEDSDSNVKAATDTLLAVTEVNDVNRKETGEWGSTTKVDKKKRRRSSKPERSNEQETISETTNIRDPPVGPSPVRRRLVFLFKNLMHSNSCSLFIYSRMPRPKSMEFSGRKVADTIRSNNPFLPVVGYALLLIIIFLSTTKICMKQRAILVVMKSRRIKRSWWKNGRNRKSKDRKIWKRNRKNN